MRELIDAEKFYEQTAEWEAQALHQVDLYNPEDSREEWLKWSYILKERGAFKHDIMDAPKVTINDLWILIFDKEDLPPDGKKVFVYDAVRNWMGVASYEKSEAGWEYWEDDNGLLFHVEDVTAWMELPSPPPTNKE